MLKNWKVDHTKLRRLTFTVFCSVAVVVNNCPNRRCNLPNVSQIELIFPEFLHATFSFQRCKKLRTTNCTSLRLAEKKLAPSISFAAAALLCWKLAHSHIPMRQVLAKSICTAAAVFNQINQIVHSLPFFVVCWAPDQLKHNFSLVNISTRKMVLLFFMLFTLSLFINLKIDKIMNWKLLKQHCGALGFQVRIQICKQKSCLIACVTWTFFVLPFEKQHSNTPASVERVGVFTCFCLAVNSAILRLVTS